MECIDSTNAICFFFTKGRDFTFNIGVNNVMFENLEGESGGQIAGVQQREIKAPKKQEATVPDVDTMMETETAVVEKVDNMKIEPPKDEPLTEVKESASVKKSVVQEDEAEPEADPERDAEADLNERVAAKKRKKEKFYDEVDNEDFF